MSNVLSFTLTTYSGAFTARLAESTEAKTVQEAATKNAHKAFFAHARQAFLGVNKSDVACVYLSCSGQHAAVNGYAAVAALLALAAPPAAPPRDKLVVTTPGGIRFEREIERGCTYESAGRIVRAMRKEYLVVAVWIEKADGTTRPLSGDEVDALVKKGELSFEPKPVDAYTITLAYSNGVKTYTVGREGIEIHRATLSKLMVGQATKGQTLFSITRAPHGRSVGAAPGWVDGLQKFLAGEITGFEDLS